MSESDKKDKQSPSPYSLNHHGVASFSSFVSRNNFSSTRKRKCPLKDIVVDYKNLPLLMRYISTDRLVILPRRITGISRKKQLEFAIAVKRARFLSLIPYV